MKPFDLCPACGNELIEKSVEKLVRGGNHTAILKVSAEVCLHCGERLFQQETIQKFEQVRERLEKQQTSGFQELGISFKVA